MAQEDARVLEIDLTEYDTLILRGQRQGHSTLAGTIHMLQHAGEQVTMTIHLRAGANFQGVPVNVSYEGVMTKPVVTKL